MFSNEQLQQKIAEAVKSGGVDLLSVITSPIALDRATALVCGLLPFGFRHLGKERVRGIILQIAERVPKSTSQTIEQHRSSESGMLDHSVVNRLSALQNQIREAFGDSFGTKKSLRGYEAQTDVLCGRLVQECDVLESGADSDRAILISILIAKAQILGNWQKLHGSKGNQRSAADCYLQALSLSEDQPDLQAEIRYRYGRFCASVDEEVGGGREKAIENFRMAAAAGTSNSAARISSEQELEKLQKRRWPF